MTNRKKMELELSLILARVYELLKLKNGSILDILHKDYTKNDFFFFPRLTLLAAQGPKGITRKIRTLAVLVQIMYLSTEIHSQVPEEKNNNNFLRETQLPILTGDFLYSKFYEVLCAEDCLEFLDEFVEYISELNLNWINYLEGKVTLKEVYTIWYGKLAEITMGLAATTSGFKNYRVEIIKKFGFSLGKMYGINKLNIVPKEIEKSWEMTLEVLKMMPPDQIKEALCMEAISLYENIRDDLGLKQGNQDVKNLRFPAVMES